MEGIFGRASRIVAPPLAMRPNRPRESRSTDTDDRRPLARAVTAEGVHTEVPISDDLKRLPQNIDSLAFAKSPENVPQSLQQPSCDSQHPSSGVQAQKEETSTHHPDARRMHTFPTDSHAKGHAHDPLSDTLFLDVGTGQDGEGVAPPGGEGSHVIMESPGAVEMDVYEAAYQEEMKKILDRKGKSATMYLTRRVEGNKDIREHEAIVDHSRHGTGASGGLAGLVKKAKENANKDEEEQAEAGAAQAS